MATSSLLLQSSFVNVQSSLQCRVTTRRQPTASSRLTVRAEVAADVVINPTVQKDVEKVVDAVAISELTKPVTAYCRCWRSGTFPLCDGGHVKHNKATGDNVGPLVLKK